MLNWNAFAEKIRDAFARLVSLEGGGLHWIALSGAVAIALLVYLLRRDKAELNGLRGFIAFCFPKRVYSSASSKLDFKYLAVNTLVYGGLIAPMVLTSDSAAYATVSVLFNIFGIPESPLPQNFFTDAALTTAIVLAADLGFFVSHYLQHRVPLLWEFHKVHHSAEVLHPITAYRSHPIDEAVKMTLVGGGTGVALGLAAYLTGQQVQGFTVLGVNVLVLLFSVAGSHLRHSHVWLSYGRFDRIFVSPAMHQIHHSCAPQHVDKNLGGMFTIWDRLAGTLYLPRNGEALPLGLSQDEHHEYKSVARLYLLPFAKIARRISGAIKTRKQHQTYEI